MSKGSNAVDISGKTAVVTGGASGMGRLLATRLAKRGAKVAIIDLNDAALVEITIQTKGITPFRCDVSDLAAVAATVKEIEERPESIIDAIEDALARGRLILFPGQAAMVHWMRGLNPGLTRKFAEMASRSLRRKPYRHPDAAAVASPSGGICSHLHTLCWAIVRHESPECVEYGSRPGPPRRFNVLP